MYLSMCSDLCRNTVRVDGGRPKNATVAQRRDDLRLTKMMLLIFCCFLLCFLPLLIFNVVDDDVSLYFHWTLPFIKWAMTTWFTLKVVTVTPNLGRNTDIARPGLNFGVGIKCHKSICLYLDEPSVPPGLQRTSLLHQEGPGSQSNLWFGREIVYNRNDSV